MPIVVMVRVPIKFNVEALYGYMTKRPNKQELWSLASLSSLEQPSGAPFKDRLLALPANIRPDWKSLLGANSPAYLASSSVAKKKVVKKLNNICTSAKCYRNLFDLNSQ